jgi:hypothetical protein
MRRMFYGLEEARDFLQVFQTGPDGNYLYVTDRLETFTRLRELAIQELGEPQPEFYRGRIELPGKSILCKKQRDMSWGKGQVIQGFLIAGDFGWQLHDIEVLEIALRQSMPEYRHPNEGTDQ